MDSKLKAVNAVGGPGRNGAFFSPLPCTSNVVFRKIRAAFLIGYPVKTLSTRPEDVVHDWIVVDAAEHTLGRLAAEIARRLRGKHKPSYTPHVDTGDFVVVVNAEKVRVSGKKDNDKIYFRHSGYPGGIKSTKLKDLRARHPERVIELAVKGMLPRNPLGRAMFRKLKVYSGPEHPHAAQQPQAVSF